MICYTEYVGAILPYIYFYKNKKGYRTMKRFIALLTMLLLAFSVSCGTADDTSDNVSNTSEVSETEDSKEEITMENARQIIKTLDYENYGRMGDLDGPAFAVYSKVGYSACSVELDIANMEINGAMSDGKFVNGYAFLGIDVYDDTGEWVNCTDVGLCWAGADIGWHLFYNIFDTLNPSTSSWYESPKKLPKNDTYTLKLEIVEDNYALLTVDGEKTNFKDSVKVEIKGAKKDGRNTAMLFNVAMDFPPDTKIDRNGNYCEDDWVEITMANTDKGACLKNLVATELKLYSGEEVFDWTDDRNDAVSIWPDKTYEGMEYSPTEIGLYDGTKYYINLDMNR